jgi:hypothetical protein
MRRIPVLIAFLAIVLSRASGAVGEVPLCDGPTEQ